MTSLAKAICFLLGASTATRSSDSVVGPTGTWQGVIQDARRPLVLTVDFAAGTGKLDAAGSTSFAVEKVTIEGGRLVFQMPLRTRVFRFEGERRRARSGGR